VWRRTSAVGPRDGASVRAELRAAVRPRVILRLARGVTDRTRWACWLPSTSRRRGKDRCLNETHVDDHGRPRRRGQFQDRFPWK
jgi:hypothetical protein